MRMQKSFILLVLAGLAVFVPAAFAGERPAYPETARVDQVDVYHGTEVADPYRWLEDDVRTNPDVAEWVAAQNRLTFSWLEQIQQRPAIRARLTELWNYERYGMPAKHGGVYYFRKNDGLQNQSVLYAVDSLDGEPRVLIDPNGWSDDGTVTLGGTSFSDDGRYMAWSLAEAGSDWRRWRIRDLRSGEDLPEELNWMKWSSVSWTADGLGFFYGRFDEPAEGAAFQQSNLNQKVFYHRLGTTQPDDSLVFERPDQPRWTFSPTVTEDGRYLVISVWEAGEKNLVFVRDLARPYAMPCQLIGGWDASYSFLGNDGPVFYFRTDLDAPRGRVVAVDLGKPERSAWRTLIPQNEDTLRSVGLVGNLFFARYLHHARSRVCVFSTTGEHLRDVDLPGLGSVGGFNGRRQDTETFYRFSSFNTPPVIYRYDLATGKSTLFRRASTAFNPDEFEVSQVFYNSKDGTRVPMFLAHRKGLKLDGSNPVLLYAYGGFNASQTPRFSAAKIAWMEMGGIYALANIRGGGEYGREWHEGATKLKRQNAFDDFIAAGEWLIKERYTRTDKLAVMGGSNGGLLVGAVMTQRPDLFGACLPAVGVMDMLRFHKFTAGRYWTDDFGSSDDPEQFKALYAYSPYHNIKPDTAYPPTLVTTADTDDRVVPGHSFKFTAEMQRAQKGDAPILIRIETRAGHGGGKPTDKAIEETTDEWSFLAATLGMDVPKSWAEHGDPAED